MADKATIENVGSKFEAWAQSLSEDEQAALAEWMKTALGDEVTPHSGNWWKEPNGWNQAWSQGWSQSWAQ